MTRIRACSSLTTGFRRRIVSLEIQPSTPGELSIPHGRLLLPQRLLVGNDRELSVEWDAWQGSRSRGTAGSICMDASLENGTKRAAEWLADAQSPTGAWPFPQKSSQGLFGYALMLDATAMIKAGKYFGDKRFADSGRKGIEFGLNQIKDRGYIPALLGIPDVDQVKAPLTCFYALGAMAAAEG